MVLPPGALDVFKQEDVVPLVLKQNGLEGSHSVPRFRTKDKGVTIVTMGIAPSLVNAIRALGGRGGMGAMAIKINVKKPEEEKTAEVAKEPETAMETDTAIAATDAEDLDDIDVPADDVNDWSND